MAVAAAGDLAVEVVAVVTVVTVVAVVGFGTVVVVVGNFGGKFSSFFPLPYYLGPALFIFIGVVFSSGFRVFA